ncbi:MAG: SagB/ThcOx family dehydrogenase [bacterium]|nr:SagB/ThcOx family dehydrogenase [bacterium]
MYEDILKRISNLSKIETILFERELFKFDKGIPFFLILKASTKKGRDLFFETLDIHEKKWFEEKLNKLEEVNPKEAEQSGKIIEKILNTIPELVASVEKDGKKIKKQIISNREIMKAGFHTNFTISDQMKGIPFPPLEKAADPGQKIIELPDPKKVKLMTNDIIDVIDKRRSRRKFTDNPLTLLELSYLLWATQGIEKLVNNNHISLRTVPSAGARHPFETYLAVHNVSDLDPGLYRYLPIEHQLVFLEKIPELKSKLNKAAFDQNFVGECAVTFLWGCVPYRGEWRYTLTSHKVMLIDIGHVCQNLYLACESINCGTCAVGAYNQEEIDELLNLDGKNEFIIYLAPVGKLNRKKE